MKVELSDINLKVLLLLLAIFPGVSFIFIYFRNVFFSSQWWQLILLSYSYTFLFLTGVIFVSLIPYLWQMIRINLSFHRTNKRILKLENDSRTEKEHLKDINEIKKMNADNWFEFIGILKTLSNAARLIVIPSAVFIVAFGNTLAVIVYVLSDHKLTNYRFSLISFVADIIISIALICIVPNYPDLLVKKTALPVLNKDN